MMKFVYTLAFLFTISISVKGQHQLIWSDEFDGETLNPDYWNYDIGNGSSGWGNNELEYYTSRPENIKIENGKLIITARYESYSGFNYTSARINTKHKKYFGYGRIEMSAKLPKGRGTWPAFWMLPEYVVYGSTYWPDNGEIDIMEYVGYLPSVVHGSVHTNENYGSNSVTSKITYYGVENDFHTYAVEWTYDTIRYYVDSYMYGSYKRSGRDWHYWPFDQNFFILLNFAVGGNWGGAQGVDNTIFPQTYEIDYVRVYDLGYNVGVSENSLNNLNTKLYPNPTTDYIDIQINDNPSGVFQISVYDIQGRQVIPTTNYQNSSGTVNLSKLNAGIYFLKVLNANKTGTFKIVKI